MAMDITIKTIKEELLRRNNNFHESIKRIQNGLVCNACSIIIPVYNQMDVLNFCLNSLQTQKNAPPFEVIIVDDYSKKSLDRKRFPQTKFPIHCYRLNKNVGSSITRNVGLRWSNNDVIIFLDADMIVPNNFVYEHSRCHPTHSNNISIGYREHILKGYFKIRKRKIADPKRDFRYERYIPIAWKKEYPRISSEVFGKTYYLLKESDNFLEFGKGRIIGIWTLPHMVLTSSMAVRKTNILKVGGFDPRFVASWYEDTFLGAKLIANGAKVIPLLNITGWHIVRNISNLTLRKKQAIFKNRQLYDLLINGKMELRKPSDFLDKLKQYDRFTKKVY